MEIALRLAHAGDLAPALADRYRALLPADDLRRVERAPAAQRPAALLARALPRLELAAALDEAPRRLRFTTGAAGKPALAAPLAFNLSHSGAWVALAWARAAGGGLALGLDIEAAAPARDVLRLARRFFAPAEHDAIAACVDPRERERAFRTLWTLKEAWVKARGEALAPRLRSVAFRIDRGAGALRPLAGAGDEDQLLALEPVPALALALCARGARSAPILDGRRGLPLAAWTPLVPGLPVLRGPAPRGGP